MIDYKEEDFVEVVREEGGANVILDIVGGPNIERNFKAACPTGASSSSPLRSAQRSRST